MVKPFPKWSELPDIDLYLDQVLLYVNQVTAPIATPTDKGLTSSMINNYVKHGLVEKPTKKKYSRKQLARLIAITTLKPVFSIQELSQVLEVITANGKSQDTYDDFVACMNNDSERAVPQLIVSACNTLKLYRQTHQIVLEIQGGKKDER